MSCSSGIDDSIFNLKYADSVPVLSSAVISGDLGNIKKLLLQGIQPQTPDNRGWTPIHCCVAENQIKALKLILKLKAKRKKYLVNLTTWEKVTPLLVALKSPSTTLEMVKLLLSSGASPNLCTHTNLSPLHLGCLKKGNIEIVKLLVESGANVNIQEDLGSFTPLHFALCEAHDLVMIKYLVGISDLTLENIYNRTAFTEACFINFTEAVKIFLEKDKMLSNTSTNIPPLVYSATTGNMEITQILLENGANVNCKCKAVLSSESDDAELTILDVENFLPIHSSLRNINIFKLLLKLTDPTKLLQVDTNFCTFPLFVMVYADNCTFFEVLLQSDLPDQLKIVSSRVFINFILGRPEMINILLKKFSMLFKYNFYLEPEDVFQNFVCQMSEEELIKNLRFLKILSEMGVSSVHQHSNKNTVIHYLQNYSNQLKQESHIIKSTCVMLSQSVLSLKQFSRIIVRRYIRSVNQNNWHSVKLVQDSGLPELLKSYLFFENTLQEGVNLNS